MTFDDWLGIAALVVGPGSVLAILLPIMFQQRKQIAETKFAVTNGHSEEHLRDQMDRQHAETLSEIAKVKGDVADVRKDVGGIRSELRGIRDHGKQQDDRLFELERTGPRRR